MRMEINVRCGAKGCKHRLIFECDATSRAADLVKLANGQGWEWNQSNPRCPEHRG